MNNNIKAKFLYDLGIRRENYPMSFLDKIQDISQIVSTTEIGYCSVSQYCDGKAEKFCIKDVVGTNHQRYAGKTWIDAFLDLDRGDNIIQLYDTNPDYWQEMKCLDNAEMGLIKYGNKYYIFDGAGGGNNRIITMKIRYLSLIAQAGNNTDEIDKINNEFTFSANVRELPEDRSIPFIVIALAEDLSGFSVRKEKSDYIVTKKFQDEELFRGNDEGIKEYFKSLFDKRNSNEETVEARLNSLRRVMGFAGKEYKEMLECILPQLKENNDLGER